MQKFIHGESYHGNGGKRTKEYGIWCNMRYRCSNPNSLLYSRYGYVGITVCKEWDSYLTFLNDMGRCPPGYSLDRINNNGNYSPNNCRWATRHEQNRNASSNIHLTAEGKTMVQAEWARELHIVPSTLINQLRKGKPFPQIVAHYRRESESKIKSDLKTCFKMFYIRAQQKIKVEGK